MPPAGYDPTLPVPEQEMEKILWATDTIREAHPKIPVETPNKLKGLILLMRYSGIRISDAVTREPLGLDARSGRGDRRSRDHRTRGGCRKQTAGQGTCATTAGNDTFTVAGTDSANSKINVTTTVSATVQ
jgi:hypothetical protein